jgi:hypothetical protein
MGSPLPLEGSNPFTGMYQSRQFGTGYQVSGSATPFYIAQYLEDPPTALVTAMEQTPLVEEAEFFDLDVQTITVTGSPASGTFILQYSTSFTSALQYNASAATVQAALRGLGTFTASVTVSGSAGGPWTVTGFTGAGSVPLQLIRVRSNSFVGGTNANVVVTSSSQQQGIMPF